MNLFIRYITNPILLSSFLLSATEVKAHSYTLGDQVWLDKFTGYTSVVTGDFNGDGRDDMMFCFADARIIVRIQQPNGTMLTTQDIPIWSPNAPNYGYSTSCRKMEVFDLNHDGKSDAVIMHSAGITTLLATDSGFDRTEIEIPYAGQEAAIASSALIDTNNNGSPDLVGVTYGGHVRVWGSTMPGSWEEKRSQIRTQGQGYMAMRAGDLNSDGLTDFAVVSSDSNFTDSKLEVFLNSGNGAFSAAQVFDFPQGAAMFNVAIGDINDDGRADVVLTNSRNSPGSILLIFRQLSTGMLATYDSYGVYQIPYAIAISDMDGDGRNDIVLNHSGWETVTTYLQELTGIEFEAYVGPISNIQSDTQALAVGDFDSDGCKDIVATVDGGYHLIRGVDCHVIDRVFISGFE